MPPHPPAAFISYCRDDQEFALRLAQDLKAAGAAVWIDQIDIAPGVTWDNAIEDALLASPRMLLVLSPASSRSQNVRNEISFALEQGKVVIPVLYRDCIVPLQLQRNNRIDFRADYAKGLTQLLNNLQVVRPNQAISDKARDLEQEAEVHRPQAVPQNEESAEGGDLAREVEAERARKEAQSLVEREVLRMEREAEAARQLAIEQQKARNDAARRTREAKEAAQRLVEQEALRVQREAEAARQLAIEEQRTKNEAVRRTRAQEVGAQWLAEFRLQQAKETEQRPVEKEAPRPKPYQ